MARRIEFDFEWRITLFTLFLLPLMISLGFWQLEREQEKSALALSFERQQALPPVPLEDLWGEAAQALAYRPALLRGRYLQDRHVLLDNRIQQGRYGNEVLTLFLLNSGEQVLVNRGWVAADPSRVSMTAVPPVTDGELAITGQVYVSPGEPYLLADEPLPQGWPKRVQAIQMDKLSGDLGGKLFPHPVRIDAGQPGSLLVDWQVVNISPAKHRGYAVQWFTMAAALFLVYLLRSTNIWQILRTSK